MDKLVLILTALSFSSWSARTFFSSYTAKKKEDDKERHCMKLLILSLKTRAAWQPSNTGMSIPWAVESTVGWLLLVRTLQTSVRCCTENLSVITWVTSRFPQSAVVCRKGADLCIIIFQLAVVKHSKVSRKLEMKVVYLHSKRCVLWNMLFSAVGHKFCFNNENCQFPICLVLPSSEGQWVCRLAAILQTMSTKFCTAPTFWTTLQWQPEIPSNYSTTRTFWSWCPEAAWWGRWRMSRPVISQRYVKGWVKGYYRECWRICSYMHILFSLAEV